MGSPSPPPPPSIPAGPAQQLGPDELDARRRWRLRTLGLAFSSRYGTLLTRPKVALPAGPGSTSGGGGGTRTTPAGGGTGAGGGSSRQSY